MARTRKAREDSNGTSETEIGHNSAGMIDATALKSYVDRAANVMTEQKELAEALKEICAEADEAGVATKREIRRLARESLMDHDVLHAQLDRMDLLRAALGGFATTPMGQAAIDSAARQ
jgi:uncharacterized protein (UPF0335 family)